jgi:hypothetical protein
MEEERMNSASSIAQEIKEKAAQPMRFPVRLTVVALLLGLAVEILFDRQEPGISFPLWSVLSVAALLAMASSEGVGKPLESLLLPIAIVVLSVIPALRAEPLTVLASGLVVVGIFIVWIRSFRMGRWLRYGWADLVLAGLWVPLECWIRPWDVLLAVWRGHVDERGRRGKWLAVVRGVILALPLLIVLSILLASADVIFEDYLQEALRWLDLEKIQELIGRGVVVIVAAIVSLGALVAALRDPGDRRLIGQKEPIVRPFLGITETSIVLASVNVLFLAFVLIQFTYLFGGQANITAAGYTYSEYARRGFGELVAVSVLTLGAIMVLGGVARRETLRDKRLYDGLSAVLVALVGVILASALVRLLLYEEAYGFTRLRTYTHIAIYWMGAGFVVFLVLLLVNRLRMFAPACALIAVAFSLTLGVIDVDAFVVRRNLARYKESDKLDVGYLAGLSADAVPDLVRFARTAPQEIREELLPALSCKREQMLELEKRVGWPSYHLSRSAALRELESLRASLQKYPVTKPQDYYYSWTVQTEGGDLYCYLTTQTQGE